MVGLGLPGLCAIGLGLSGLCAIRLGLLGLCAIGLGLFAPNMLGEFKELFQMGILWVKVVSSNNIIVLLLEAANLVFQLSCREVLSLDQLIYKVMEHHNVTDPARALFSEAKFIIPSGKRFHHPCRIPQKCPFELWEWQRWSLFPSDHSSSSIR